MTSTSIGRDFLELSSLPSSFASADEDATGRGKLRIDLQTKLSSSLLRRQLSSLVATINWAISPSSAARTNRVSTLVSRRAISPNYCTRIIDNLHDRDEAVAIQQQALQFSSPSFT